MASAVQCLHSRDCGHGDMVRNLRITAIFAITRPGLIAISLSVAFLWGLIAAGAVVRNHALSQQRALLRQMPQRPRDTQPAKAPVRIFSHQPASLSS